MEKLTITADREDYIVGLVGHLVIGEYAGTGEGWHNNTKVVEFCRAIEKISETMEGTAELIGSEGCTDTPEFLETFSIRVSSINKSKLNGTLSVYVKMAYSPHGDRDDLETLSVSGEMKVRNHRAKKFASDLESLLQGKLDTVVLEGDNVI